MVDLGGKPIFDCLTDAFYTLFRTNRKALNILLNGFYSKFSIFGVRKPFSDRN